MFDRTLVTSGFDIEALVSERYLSYIILAQIESGRLATRFDVVDAERGLDLTITLHPPTDYQRLYEPEPSAPLPPEVLKSFSVRLLPEGDEAFMHVTAAVSVENRANGQSFDAVPAGMLLGVELEAETADNGLEKGHELVLTLVRFDDATRTVLSAFADPEEVEAALRPFVDRRIPLGLARGQRVHQVRLKRFFRGDRGSLGVYLDLALRSGPKPEDLLQTRGDLGSAQNFLEQGTDLAFSTSPGLFALVGPDLKFRQAEIDPENDSVSFPLRKNPRDPDSEVIGRIKDLRVGPKILQRPNQPPIFTNELLIKLHGEYTDAPGDPDFDLLVTLSPESKEGVVDLDIDIDVQLGLLATLVLVAGGIVLTFLFGPGVGLGSGVIAGSLIGLAVLRGLIAQPLAAKLLEDRIDEETEASILDVLPFRIPAARRRWDPFYLTEHQVVARVDSIVVDDQGFAFEATDLVLDKEAVPINHVVIRDKQRSGSRITALRYRVADFARIADDVTANAPGRDRMAFERTDPEGEPTLVDLTLEQIAARIDRKRLLAPITYTAERIHLVDNQIDHMLTISRRERGEASRRVINRFRAERREVLMELLGQALIAAVTEELELELGRPPTEGEVQERVDAFIDPILDDLQALFEKGEFPELREQEVLRNLRFELLPEQYVELQEAGIFVLDGKEIIVRRTADGFPRPYYRDRPDGIVADNLLELPKYTPPFEVPV